MYLINNKRKELERLIQSKNFSKIFVLSGKNSYHKSGASKILKSVLSGKNVYYYFKKSAYPIISELKKIIVYLEQAKPDLVIAVGGGSVLDYAKMASILKISKNFDQEIISSNYNVKKKLHKLLAIPTTAGSGAEITSNSVIYINKKKYSVEHQKLKPDFFIIIPELIIKGSKTIKASAGFDAISQSLESLISKKSNPNSVLFAKQSLKISLKYFIQSINNPSIENTFKMGLAANLSGKAIDISKTTAPHALSYPFTAYFNISHGHAVSLTLNDFMRFNFFNIKKANCSFDLNKRFEFIFKIAKVRNIIEFDKFLTRLKKKIKLESNYKKLGIEINKDYPKILSGVNTQRLENNPVEINISDLKTILLKNNNLYV